MHSCSVVMLPRFRRVRLLGRSLGEAKWYFHSKQAVRLRSGMVSYMERDCQQANLEAGFTSDNYTGATSQQSGISNL